MRDIPTFGPDTDAMLRAVIEPPSANTRWQPPHELDGLRIVRSLGRGGMGHVFLAEEIALGRLVAIKFLAPRTNLSHERNAQLLSEARVLAGLRHPGIVVLYRVGSIDDRAYLVHEFVDGPSLAQATKPMPARRVLRIGHDASGALAAVHAAGIVHGDVKPSNVMLASDDSARLIDFGLAHVESRPPHLQGGTAGYLAPEAIRTGRSTSRSDVYAFSRVVLELLTGSLDPAALGALPRPRARAQPASVRALRALPYAGSSASTFAWIPGRLAAQPASVRALRALPYAGSSASTFAWIPPPELVDAVERGLSHDEHRRPTSAALHDLFGSLLSSHEIARPAGLPDEPSTKEVTAPSLAKMPADGAPYDVVETPLGKQVIWMPKPWIVLARQHGILDVETARSMHRASERSMSLGFRPSGFVDARDVKGYTPEHRVVSTRWIARSLPSLAAMHVLTRSRMVTMGIAVANLALRGSIVTHGTPEPFDLALERALAHPTRR